VGRSDRAGAKTTRKKSPMAKGGLGNAQESKGSREGRKCDSFI